jgi:hypothetical protein
VTDPKTEHLLKRFLEEDAAAREAGITLPTLHRLVLDIAADRLVDRKAATQDRAAAAEDRRAVALLTDGFQRHGRRLRAMERQLETVSERPEVPDWRPDPREITGTHDYAVIKAQHDEMRANSQWWQRQVWIWIFAAAGAVFLAGFTGCVAYAVSHLTMGK